MRTYVHPLVEDGRLLLGLQDNPKSSKQTYRAS